MKFLNLSALYSSVNLISSAKYLLGSNVKSNIAPSETNIGDERKNKSGYCLKGI